MLPILKRLYGSLYHRMSYIIHKWVMPKIRLYRDTIIVNSSITPPPPPPIVNLLSMKLLKGLLIESILRTMIKL